MPNIYSLCIRHEIDDPFFAIDDHVCSFQESSDKEALEYIENVLFDEEFHDNLKLSMMQSSYRCIAIHKNNDRGDNAELLHYYYSHDVLKSIQDKEMDLYE
jgi:hypothetical protein